MKMFSLAFLLLSSGVVLLLSGCDILYPPIKVQFADTTLTAPNGSFVLYGTVSQTPLDSATLVRLRSEGYTGGTDKAPVVGAEVTATNGDTKLTTTTDRLGRYVLVTKNSGTYSLIAKHYTTVMNTPLSFDVKANMQKDITVSPAKEFVFPLTVGNKWVYDYNGFSSSTNRVWEIIRQEQISAGTQYIVQLGKYEDISNPQTYSVIGTFAIISTSRYVIIPDNFILNTPPDSLAHLLVKQTSDSLKFEENSGTSSRNRVYVNKVGLVNYYADGGSPASGRWSVSLKLRSYSLK